MGIKRRQQAPGPTDRRLSPAANSDCRVVRNAHLPNGALRKSHRIIIIVDHIDEQMAHTSSLAVNARSNTATNTDEASGMQLPVRCGQKSTAIPCPLWDLMGARWEPDGSRTHGAQPGPMASTKEVIERVQPGVTVGIGRRRRRGWRGRRWCGPWRRWWWQRWR